MVYSTKGKLFAPHYQTYLLFRYNWKIGLTRPLNMTHLQVDRAELLTPANWMWFTLIVYYVKASDSNRNLSAYYGLMHYLYANSDYTIY